MSIKYILTNKLRQLFLFFCPDPCSGSLQRSFRGQKCPQEESPPSKTNSWLRLCLVRTQQQCRNSSSRVILDDFIVICSCVHFIEAWTQHIFMKVGVRTNPIQYFTAVTFSVKLGVDGEKLTLTRNPVKFHNFP